MAPILRRHVVLVFVDHLDLATARALQYARTLNPDELRAVHFVLDSAHAAELESQWVQLGLVALSPRRRRVPRPPPDQGGDGADRRGGRRRPDRGERAAAPPRVRGLWRRVLHDHTADHIAAYRRPAAERERDDRALPAGQAAQAAGPLEGGRQSRAHRPCTTPSSGRPSTAGRRTRRESRPRPSGPPGFQSPSTSGLAAGTVPIGNLRPRQPARVAGRIKTVRVQPRAGVSSLECTDRGRERPAAGRVPGPPARRRDRAGRRRRRRGDGRGPGSQPRHGEPALLDHLDIEADRERPARQGPPRPPPLRGPGSHIAAAQEAGRGIILGSLGRARRRSLPEHAVP